MTAQNRLTRRKKTKRKKENSCSGVRMITRAEIDSLKGLASNIVSGDSDEYTESMFFEDFPQFKKAGSDVGFVPTAMMKAFLNMANSTVSAARWCESWRIAIGLFVAHYVTMYLRQSGGNTDGSATAKKAAETGALMGIVSSASLGDASVSYDTSSATQATQAWGQFNLTTYGQQYASLARLCCLGGSYVI